MEEPIEVEGRITAVLAGTMFRAKLENGHEVLAHAGHLPVSRPAHVFHLLCGPAQVTQNRALRWPEIRPSYGSLPEKPGAESSDESSFGDDSKPVVGINFRKTSLAVFVLPETNLLWKSR